MKTRLLSVTVTRRTALALAATAAALHAQEYPSRPITLLAPAAPGGSTDAICRVLAQALSQRLGSPVVVENRPGAGGALATVSMAGARPDGYTLSLMPLAVYRIALMQKMPFDPLRDVSYMAALGGYVFGVAVAADAPYRTLADVLAHARRIRAK